MSNNPSNNNHNTEQPTTVTGICQFQNCNTPLSLPFPPVVQAHHPTADALIVPHTKGISCPRCNTYYSLAVVNYQLAIALVPDAKPILNEDNLIEPASNLIGFPRSKT